MAWRPCCRTRSSRRSPVSPSPPLLLILFAILTDSSIGDLFIGGIGPGLLLTAAYILYLSGLGIARPNLFDGIKGPEHDERTPVWNILPVFALATLVLSGIYLGFFTPTEAGAVGAAAALIIGVLLRRIGPRAAWRIAVQTGHITAAVCFLIIGASIYSRMLAYSGLPASITEAAIGSGIGPVGFLLLFAGLLVLLGTVLDSSSIMLVTVPLAYPVTQQMGIDIVHFGLITVLAVEVGLLTPPLGLSVFVVHATLKDTGITLGEVFRGAAPFALIMALSLVALIFIPQIATGLLGR